MANVRFGASFSSVKCKGCNDRYISSRNGLPSMVGFELEDGNTINLCQRCLTKLGSLDDAGKSKFIEEVLK